jgi:hypothetical protein
MAEYAALGAEEVRAIAGAYLAAREGKSVPQERPTIVLVGGQPGAGKSKAAHLARVELASRGGFVHVDADRMRERLPRGEARPTSEQTQADAGRLATTLRELATQGRRNIVEEGTFRNAEGLAKFIDGRKAAGYAVEILAVATPREESLLGIYQRFELQHAAGADNPRFVPEAYHDDAMQGFAGALAHCAGAVDRVRVVDRAGVVLFDSARQENTHTSAVSALAAGRELTDAKLGAVGRAWEAVRVQAEARLAPTEIGPYLAAVKGHAGRIASEQTQRIDAHGRLHLVEHARVLSNDQRFKSHTSGELLKAAYFRGVHEKAAAFDGRPPDFGKLDAALASRERLQRLPDVPELPEIVERDRSRDRHDNGHSL